MIYRTVNVLGPVRILVAVTNRIVLYYIVSLYDWHVICKYFIAGDVYKETLLLSVK